jgi:hypothetical protein
MKRAQWFLLFLLAASLPAAASGAAAWTDRGEYDLVLQLHAEAVPARRLALLEQWQQKYPKSELRHVRRELYLVFYQMNGDSARMLDVAREMLAEDPKGFTGVYWVATLVPSVRNPKPEVLAAGEKASRQLLDGLNGYFAPRSGGPDAAGAAKQKTEVEIGAHRTLGWVSWQRGQYEAAEKEFATCLRLDPKNAEISSWFGTVLAVQRKPETQPAALWHLARAVSVQGDSALSPSQRRELDGLLEQFYAGYHGGPDGLTELRGGAAAAPLPPAGFAIDSAAVVTSRRQREEVLRTRPELAPWFDMRQKLEAADGDAYFATLKTGVSPEVKGTLIRFEPSGKPKRLVLGVVDAAKEEVVLDLDQALSHEAELGIQLEFSGKPASYTRDPFRLTLDVERSAVKGWPAPARKRK